MSKSILLLNYETAATVSLRMKLNAPKMVAERLRQWCNMQKYQWPTDWPPSAKTDYFKPIQQQPQSTTMVKFMSTGKYSEEQDKISANSKPSQDKHWIPSKTTEDPRGPDKV
jgi:hypothetical protein